MSNHTLITAANYGILITLVFLNFQAYLEGSFSQFGLLYEVQICYGGKTKKQEALSMVCDDLFDKISFSNL